MQCSTPRMQCSPCKAQLTLVLVALFFLRDFENVNLTSTVYAGNLKLGKPNRVFTVRVSTEHFQFPLRAEYVRRNRTLEGIRESAGDREGDMEKLGRLMPNWLPISRLRSGPNILTAPMSTFGTRVIGVRLMRGVDTNQ